MRRITTEDALFSIEFTQPTTATPVSTDFDDAPHFSGEFGLEPGVPGLDEGCVEDAELEDAASDDLPPPTAEAEPPANVAADTFEALYRQYYRRVYAVCLRMTGNPDDAEDLTHDVFIQVLRKLSSFRGEAAFTTWLHRIAVNQVLMHFRKKSNRVESVTEEGDMPEDVTPVMIRQSQTPLVDRLALLSAVKKLPRGYRTVFILHDLKGYEHEEIGGLLGISAGTSKSQLHKARARMQELLTGARAA
ncbi:MAG: RNA polymerase sigma factor [Chloracidobacterium sp.]|nr:RNA polymerase sigma factor [Chloracidobacterium sp.]MDW8218504.1 RNA polymerase sigma factor [Acidobacteriota bacterium]